MIYLDANASEPLRPAARDAAMAGLEIVGNPASVHAAGRLARAELERARGRIAGLCGVAPAEVIFTSGGTEANAMAVAALSVGRRVILGATEHDAVRSAAGAALILPVERSGQPDLAVLARLLASGGPALVCLMLANNETGVLHPVAEAARLCRAHGALLHVDAVQAAGRVAIDRTGLGADSLAISAHKIGGPKGAGALVLRPGLEIAALFAGGGQERGRRGGTPGLPALMGFGAAVEAPERLHEAAARLGPWRDRIEDAAIALGAVICGDGPRLANTTCLALPKIPADRQVIALDLAGIAVSAGAACSSGKVARSHVLEAMGLCELAGNAIRVSLPWNCTELEIDSFILAYTEIALGSHARLGEMSHPPQTPRRSLRLHPH